MSNSNNRGSDSSSHFEDSKSQHNRGGYYRDRPRNGDDHKEDHRGDDRDYRRRDSKGRRRNRWDDNDERDRDLSTKSTSHRRGQDKDKDGREYRRHWRDRSRSPVEKRKSPQEEECRVRKDIFENAEVKKEDSKKSRSSSNWSDSSDDEDGGLKSNKHRQDQPGENGTGSYESYQYNEIKNRFVEPAADGFNDSNGNSLSKPNFYQNLSANNYSQPLQNSFVRDDQAKSMVDIKFPIPEMPESKAKPSAGIQIRLLPPPVKASPVVKPAIAKPKVALKVASVFNVDDDDDEEEMPAECKMRMKNIGRETPTSAGPNSFGKTKIGFCNMATIKERRLQEDILKKK